MEIVKDQAQGLRPANPDTIALTLIRVAQLITGLPQITALDINPLLADDYGAVALDARMRVRKSCATHSDRPAIRPYSKAEYAIIVRRDINGQGVGRLFMHRTIDYCRRRGTRLVFDEVLPQNTVMLHLCKTLGFRQHSILGEPAPSG